MGTLQLIGSHEAPAGYPGVLHPWHRRLCACAAAAA